MIHRTIPLWQSKSWQQELAELITDPEQLLVELNLDNALLPAAKKAHQLFPLRTTRAYLSRIAPNTPDDPLLRQILPLGVELQTHDAFSEDPLQEQQATPTPGLIHKYHGRVLLITAGQCAINCRYCFRRHFDYAGNALSQSQWQQALAYIQADDSIEEVILSGGDPLVVNDKQLTRLIDQLAQITHLTRLRIHTRLPIVVPSRVTAELLTLLDTSRLETVVVIHCNHPQEIDQQVGAALRSLSSATTVLNQSVLLRGVNNHSSTLETLSKQLFAHRVLPYYLHMLDPVTGAAHFAVDDREARALMQSLLANLPGYLVPKLVSEQPQALSKIPIN